ncbi:MAG TPA: hypothetical protein VM008_11820 [Phycisphaerae bacterium]|nr:hypothetical protein [Phycisphaerae bacterium]
MTKKKVTVWMGLNRWKLVCGAIIATAATVGATIGPALHWAAAKDKTEVRQGAQIDEYTAAITAIESKLDKVAEDTSEIRGSVNTLLKIMQASRQAGASRMALQQGSEG